jgi:hypothetical protein
MPVVAFSQFLFVPIEVEHRKEQRCTIKMKTLARIEGEGSFGASGAGSATMKSLMIVSSQETVRGSQSMILGTDTIYSGFQKQQGTLLGKPCIESATWQVNILQMGKMLALTK